MMRPLAPVFLMLVSLSLFWHDVSAAPPATHPSEEEEEVVYRPPAAATGSARIGGGSRTGSAAPSIAVLAPEHVGLSGSPRPKLYWFCAKATNLPCEFSLVNAQTNQTITRVVLNEPIDVGWQKIDLQQLGVELERDQTYDWTVSIVVSPDQRSENPVARGAIQHVLLPVATIEEPPVRQAARRAGAGLWYDAIDLLMGQIDSDPAARRALAGLLRQVKLDEAADFAEKQ
ncbi:MAG: DUF928 domain-containing protein [Phycisphaerae bacterium]|nr:DUF928 domain-containing protein [Phycisphaerae bacterium]MDW8260944.1 DUF928 domain-containing protein [Phycisphaerales bacterium]